MSLRRFLSRLAAYAWAAPNTALGAMAGLVMLCLGGRLSFVAGVAEFHGGWAGRVLAALPAPFRFGAMTLGHVILGIGKAELARLRAHEHAHVRQYEQWGPFFLPAYALSSVWQVAHGRCGYRNNFFERRAYAIEARSRHDPCSGERASGPMNSNRRSAVGTQVPSSIVTTPASASRRKRQVLGVAAFLVAVAMLGAALRPSPLLSLARHWFVFGAYAAVSAAIMVTAVLLVGGRFRMGVFVAWVLLAGIAALAHPVCVPIPERARPAFETALPLDARAARGEPFRNFDGQWYQCKSFVSRATFF